MTALLKDLIQSEKEISRPSQQEAGFKSVAESDVTCASCRWFKSEDGGNEEGYCHLIQNAPSDISDASTCDRHEAALSPDSVTEPIEDESVKEIDFTETVPATEVPPIVETEPETAPVLMEAKSDDAPIDRSMPKSPLIGILDRVEAKIKAALGNPFKSSDPDGTGFKVAGNQFLIVWSNNFEDRDGELFTQKAMDDYVARVEGEVVPPPELWLWHAGKETRIGEAAWVARHGHFLLAVGEFDTGVRAERARAYFQKHARKTGVSHGYTYPADQFDGKHKPALYHAFNTFEISLLPRGREANRFTTLERIKQMALKPEQKKYVEDVFGEAALTELDEAGKAIEEAGAAYKDYLAPSDAVADASPAESADMKAFVTELISDNANLATLIVAGARKQTAEKAAFDARLEDLTTAWGAKFEKQAADIAALQDQLDSRPKSASKAEETELDVAKLQAITEQADRQQAVKDNFWQTTYVPESA